MRLPDQPGPSTTGWRAIRCGFRSAGWCIPAAIVSFAIALSACAGASGSLDDGDRTPAAGEPSRVAGDQTPVSAPDERPEFAREFRGVWVATVANIDWPSEPGLPVEKQKEELIAILDRAAEMNLNAIVLQVRPAADALYDSPYEPWSEYLTGEMGRAPEPYYDPLAFAVEEAHARGLELHAWFNPYRAYHASATSPISPDHISRTRPDIVRQYGDYLWLDPGERDAAQHTLNVIMDVVERYDIDGVHFDDYFYPYRAYAEPGNADFPDSSSWARAREAGVVMDRDDWRRNNVDRLIERVYEGIKARKPHVKFGISPFGLYRPGHPEGTYGFDAYDELYADARKWLREGWVDYFTPQLYYRMAQHNVPYSVVLRWWIDQNVHERHIWPGLYSGRAAGALRRWPVEEIIGQIYATRAQPGASGHVHFSMRAFMREPDSLARELMLHPYKEPALVPAMPWLDHTPPGRVGARLEFDADGVFLVVTPPNEDDLRLWAIRVQVADSWQMLTAPASRTRIRLDGVPRTVVISAVDRVGNEGAAATVQGPDPIALRPEIIPHSAWEAHPPLGHLADAARRNIAPGDTAMFRDLTVQIASMSADSALVILSQGRGADAAKHDTIVAEQTALTWRGYRIGFLAFNAEPGRLGAGLAELEIAVAATLPLELAASPTTGGAESRLRVPHDIRRLTLHHSGSPEPLLPEDDPTEKLRGLQIWGAAERNWWDVPYHFLIDLEGRIYEGRDYRYIGETNTAYDPRGHLLISVIGNYNRQDATDAQVDAITQLMAWAAAEFGVSPGEIYGHSDFAETSCPGRAFQALLDDGTFARGVADRLAEVTR